MIVTKKSLPRRTFLRGMGVSLALPLLDAMVPAMTAQAATAAAPVPRLGITYIPMGAHLPDWTPRSSGTLAQLSPILDSLAPFRDQLSVISNLENKNAYSAGNHATANSGFLSAAEAKMTEGSDYELATTMDQIAARQIGRAAPLPSLELAMDILTTVGNCDNGFACVYQNNLSWSSPTAPLPTEAHPRVVFERLFGEGGDLDERRADLRRDASILDWVNADMLRLKGRLGASDRIKIDEYLDSIREVERRIQNAERRTQEMPAPDIDRPLEASADYEAHAKLMFDLQTLAFRGDITRVITFQLARETSTRTYPQIGVPDPHHPVSHHANDPDKVAKLSRINAYHVSLFAYYLEKLRSTPDGDGSLLDHSIQLCGSGMGNPDVHDHKDLPILVAGGGVHQARGGRHLQYSAPVPLANLHLSLLDRLGVRLESFADSDGKIADLLDSVSL